MVIGVPITSQWYEKGHVYPLQVAQFGLSYYSRWKDGPNNKTKPFIIKLDRDLIGNDEIKQTKNGLAFKFKGLVSVFSGYASYYFVCFSDQAVIKLNQNINKIIFFMADVYTDNKILIIINLKFYEKKYKKIQLVYQIDNQINNTFQNEFIFLKNENPNNITIRYLINGYKIKFKMIRNLFIDVCKAIKTKECLTNYQNSTKTHYKILSIVLKGDGILQNPILTDNASFEIAKQSADYLIQTQNRTTGSWPMKIVRKFRRNDKLYLNINWNSAMLQGHALSLLSRIYLSTKNSVYLESALKAVEIFNVSVDNNGIKTYFFGKYVWYEEYPTKPNSLFVLNGFIYSLIGLYDFYSCLKQTGNDSFKFVYSLYKDGIESLRNIITVFDTGSRTFYDLRHISNGQNSEPNIARWDYHVLHINQLLYLSTIEQDKDIFVMLAKRWIGYTNGEWSKHN